MSTQGLRASAACSGVSELNSLKVIKGVSFLVALSAAALNTLDHRLEPT
jgi:hypothetical protein